MYEVQEADASISVDVQDLEGEVHVADAGKVSRLLPVGKEIVVFDEAAAPPVKYRKQEPQSDQFITRKYLRL